jgi:hypothetical protein
MKLNTCQTILYFYILSWFLWIKFSSEDTPSTYNTLMFTPSSMISLTICYGKSGSVTIPSSTYNLISLSLHFLTHLILSLTLFVIGTFPVFIFLIIILFYIIHLVYSFLSSFICFIEIIVSLKFLPHLYFTSLFLPKYFITIKCS